jgi:4-hydroxybenzoate polyprenyltransferase
MSERSEPPVRQVRGATRLRRLVLSPTPPARRPSPGVVVRALVRQLRPKQWVKNLACLAGLIFSGQLLQAKAEAQALVAFWAFCFASSAVYIINDYFDREKDRRNPRTASRPLASGDLPLAVAFSALVALLAVALGASAALGRPCLLAVLCYIAVNVLYTTRLKRVVIVDVMCIAIGFVLRMIYGVLAVGVAPTSWIILCMFFLALFLGFAKRRGELCSLEGQAHEARLVLKKYRVPFLDMLLTITATLAILSYALFTVISHKNPTLIVTIVPVVYCVSRYLLRVSINQEGESPDSILVSDWRLWAGILGWVGLYVLVAYGDIRFVVEGV